jgi:hypothetical protein
MSNQGLGISGTADANNSAAFNPLMLLAEVAIQDAIQDAYLQDTVMQDADTEDAYMQNAAEHDAATQEGDRHATVEDDTDENDTAQQNTKQDEAANGNPSGYTRQVVTADQLLSMLADPSSSMDIGYGDGDADDEDDDDVSGTTAKDEPNAKGERTARRKKTVEERAREIAAAAQKMAERDAEDEKKVLEEMKLDEERDKRAAEAASSSTLQAEIEATGILPENAVLMASLLDKDSEEELDREEHVVVSSKRRLLRQAKDAGVEVVRKKFDFFSSLSNYLEFFMELAKHLRINDLVSLYAISKDFHETLNGHLSHILKACAAYQAPESSRIFVFTLYRSLCIPDPVGRPDPKNPVLARMVPSLRWLRMVIHREKCVRDILACMAREGHRMPKTISMSMKKMWLTMDIPTSARRVQLMHNENYWTDNDLYNLQMLFVKLDLQFNDPLEGPGDDGLRKLMLGQRGLTPLRDLLKRTRFTDTLEALEACVRYSYWPRPEHRNLPILGVPANEVGRGHLEGWGVGQVHLYRMDELVMRESCRRNMDLKSHIITMMAWGYVNAATKENIKVTREEMYMSDDSEVAKRNKIEIDDGRRKPKRDKSKEKRKDNKGQKEEDKGKGKGKGKAREKTVEKNKTGPYGEIDTHMAG